MIKTNQLKKVFTTDEIETTALNDIKIEIGKGEFVAIMGPSGSGKSTLLYILGLLDSFNSGEYYFDDTPVAKYSEKQRRELRRKNVSFIFQSFNLIDELTVFENVELPLINSDLSKSERRSRVETVLERVGMSHRATHFPRQLSGGQQQRVAVARAVVINPKLILADEPTGNLDSKNGEEVMKLLTELNQEGTTIIMVTHSDKYAQYAGRVFNIFDGILVKEIIN